MCLPNLEVTLNALWEIYKLFLKGKLAIYGGIKHRPLHRRNWTIIDYVN
jgi:hypothetical protein